MTEQELQKSIVEWWRLCAASPTAWMTAINPVPAKSKAVAGLSKAMGMAPGVADLLIIWRPTPWSTAFAFVEVKTSNGRRSGAQERFAWEMDRMCVHNDLVRSLDDFRRLVQVTLGIPTREAKAA